MATAAPTAAPPSNNKAHLYRLLTLTVDEGTSMVRRIFDDKLPNRDLNEFLKQEHTQQELKRIPKFQKDKLDTPGISLEDCDLSLILCLLRNLSCFGLNYPWKDEPKPEDTNKEDDLSRLRNMRNKLAHIPSTTVVSEQDFQDKWSDIENALLRLNESLQNTDPNLQQRINECKNKPLDPEILKEIKKRIEELQKKLGTTDERLGELEKDVQTLKFNQEQQKSQEGATGNQNTVNKYGNMHVGSVANMQLGDYSKMNVTSSFMKVNTSRTDSTSDSEDEAPVHKK